MTEQPDTVTVTRQDVEAALRKWLAIFNYDAHKNLEYSQDDGEDHYPQEAANLFTRLRTAAGGQQ